MSSDEFDLPSELSAGDASNIEQFFNILARARADRIRRNTLSTVDEEESDAEESQNLSLNQEEPDASEDEDEGIRKDASHSFSFDLEVDSDRGSVIQMESEMEDSDSAQPRPNTNERANPRSLFDILTEEEADDTRTDTTFIDGEKAPITVKNSTGSIDLENSETQEGNCEYDVHRAASKSFTFDIGALENVELTPEERKRFYVQFETDTKKREWEPSSVYVNAGKDANV